jgi:hypothetical protein
MAKGEIAKHTKGLYFCGRHAAASHSLKDCLDPFCPLYPFRFGNEEPPGKQERQKYEEGLKKLRDAKRYR